MDDFVKEPDRMDFVDSDHIMNYLENNMGKFCDSSVMKSQDNGMTDDDDRLDRAEGLLDNLIKTVCTGIDESTLIAKGDSDVAIIADNDRSSDSDIMRAVRPCVIENSFAKDIGDSGSFGSIGAANSDTNESADSDRKEFGDSMSNDNTNIVDMKASSPSGDENSLVRQVMKSDLKKSSNDEEKSSGKDKCELNDEKTPSTSNDYLGVAKTDAIQSSPSGSKEPSEYPSQYDSSKKDLSGLAFPPKAALALGNTESKKVSSPSPARIQPSSPSPKAGESPRLVFPSNAALALSAPKKKKLPNYRPMRPKAGTRITIAEALEKAQDAQKSISEMKKSTGAVVGSEMSKRQGSSEVESKEELTGTSQQSSLRLSNLSVDVNEVSDADSALQEGADRLLSHTNQSTPSPSHSPALSIEDQEDKTEPGNSQERSRQRAKPGSRYRLTQKMTELLRFTFDHEHFPSSVNMARLAKIMGVTWSQIRNWFTNRRVENKRNCIFPRDKMLEYCPYCCLILKTEAEQKGHLFASQHIRKILGTDHIDTAAKPAKWKHRPQDLMISSKVNSQDLSPSGSNSTLDTQSDGEDVESKTDKLGKRWKDSFLINAKGKNKTLTDSDWEKAFRDQEKLEYSSDISNKEKGPTLAKSDEDESPSTVPKNENAPPQHPSVASEGSGKGTIASGTVVNNSVSSYTKGKTYDMKLRDTVDNLKSKYEEYKKKKSGYEDCKTQVLTLKSNSLPLRNNKSSFSKPSLSHMEDSIMGYQCPKCFKIFKTEWQLLKHAMTHLLFMCGICNSSFPTEHELKLHLHDHLTGAYEEEKYYSQFSCKVCHSLTCGCYEPHSSVPRDLPKALERPQKAKRSKKTFSTKPFSGPNDHLRVTFGSYKKYLDRSASLESCRIPVDNPTVSQSFSRSIHTANVAAKLENDSSPSSTTSKILREQEFPPNKVEQGPQTSQKPKLYVRKDLLENSNPTTESATFSASAATAGNGLNKKDMTESAKNAKNLENEPEVPKKKGRPYGSRNASKPKDYVYMDGDFYYMCEICDSSFFSKAELQEHMFFHRLKSRSRRGEKRGLEATEGNGDKKAKVDETKSLENAETINVVGFERFKCSKCKGHFASKVDLNRHKTQAHSDDLSTDSLEVLKCNYCEKTYRRERELRRHLKHACRNAPKRLKSVLCVGTTLMSLQEKGDGPHYTVVNKSLGTLLNENSVPNTRKEVLYKCRYCLFTAKQEQDMKPHVEKYCYCMPKSVRSRFKQGVSLESLGFQWQADEVEDTPVSSPAVTAEKEAEDQPSSIPDAESPVPEADDNSTVEVSPEPSTSSSLSSSILDRHKEPLVCAYCGIWYYRKISLIRHMRERCIVIPALDRERLNQGADLCDTTDNSAENPKLLSTVRGIYQKVEGHDSTPVEPKVRNTNLIGKDKPLEPETEKPKKLILCKLTNEDLKNSELIQKNSPAKEVKGSDSDSPVKEDMMHKNTSAKLAQFSWSPFKGDSKVSRSLVEEDFKQSNTSVKGVGGSDSPVKDPILPDKPEVQQGKRNVKQKNSRCSRCHEIFKTPDAVLAHSSVHHGPKKGLYKCKLCGERFPRYKQLREHVWTHTEEAPYKCHICDLNFRVSDKIITHLSFVHCYTKAHEKNIFKWLPGRNGKYREIGVTPEETKETSRMELEETFEGLETNLENLAEDMVITDKIWTKEKDSSSFIEHPTSSHSANTVRKGKDGESDSTVEEKYTKSSSETKNIDEDIRKISSSTKEGTSAHSSRANKSGDMQPGESLKRKKDSPENSDSDSGVPSTRKGKFFKRTNSFKGEKRSAKKADDDDDDGGELLNFGTNLDSIIETVNLTDESFL